MTGEGDSERTVAGLIQQLRDYAVIALDPQGLIETWNAGAQAVKGYSPGEALGRHFSMFYAAEDRDDGLPQRLLERARADGRVEHTGWRLRKDGSRFWADVIITALYDEDGRLTGFGKVTRDLTEQHELEASLQESETRYRSLVSQVVDYAIIALDPHGLIQSWNSGAEAVKGYTAEEIIGRHFSTFYTDDDRRDGLPLRLLDQARTLGRVEHIGWRVRKDGTRFWGDVVITALRDPDGNLTGYGKVTRDLTEQHALETSLRQSEARFRLLVSQVVDYAIIALDAQGIIESWNAGAEAVKGYTAEEIIGRHFSIFYSEEDRRAGLPLRLLDQARAFGRVQHTGWRLRKDGTRFWGEVMITTLHDDSGRLTGFGKVTRDLTDRLVLEKARESFFAAVGHDLKTPITAVQGFAQLLESADDRRRAVLVDRIRANADRLALMVDDLVDYARVKSGAVTLKRTSFGLTDLVSEAVGTLDVLLAGHHIEVTGAAVDVHADRRVVERIVTNLLSNAVKYSPAGSTVHLEVRALSDRGRLTVTDEGRGIHPDDLGGIFEEFQRGRLARTDGGSGLGLASVKQLVELHGGEVWIDSKVGNGTTVTVDLPRAPASAHDCTPVGVPVPR